MKFRIEYGIYSSRENEKIVEVETMDDLYNEIGKLFIETADNDGLGRDVETIMEEEDVDYNTACEIYYEEIQDLFCYEIEEIEANIIKGDD